MCTRTPPRCTSATPWPAMASRSRVRSRARCGCWPPGGGCCGWPRREVARAGAPVRDAYQAAREAGAELVVFAGASSIDPLDAAYEELQAAGGKVLRVGAPSHPGSMLWLGRLAEAPVLGIASCAGFGKNTSLDLVLPFVFAYGRAEPEDFIRLGHGGLVEAGARPPLSTP